MAHTQEALYSNKIFLNAALPLVKVIANDDPKLKKKFEKAHAVIQVSCLDPEVEGGKRGMHFVVNSGEWLVHTCLTEDPHIELQFKSVEALNDFFKGNITPAGIPKIKGLKKADVLISFVMVLLKMANLLGATEAPKDEATKELLVKCYFYLLSSGISQLNKLGHPEIKDWTTKSPDRVYAFAVDGYPQIGAYLRIKAGKSRAGRGEYKRAMPFFTLRFNNLDSALGILMSTDDMLEATKAGRLIMDGGPEFGAQLGGFMLEIGALAK
ncbi:MAG: hypothetical protein II356_04640 [Clostridia bacterium]|nr:hypothetical protein [Clostridia bacterium]MBQ1995287.1 hypothetical protein [Clostridia bacterium]MBQ5906373.1 hypothetical protein [Clostridia bacterium]